jgi:1-acyl-sn-glycerol-3-phosphate acyltransferase
MILKALAKLIYGLRGWTFEPLPDYWTKKSVIIGFPHRENMDTVMAFAGFARVKVKGHILIKSSFFFWPMSTLLRAFGGIPVDRSAPGGLVRQIVGEFEARDEFILALVPEGTRKGVSQLKTGFWHIARNANVPIICWYLDSTTKRTRWVGHLQPGPSLDDDMRTIAGFYEDAGFSIPLNS